LRESKGWQMSQNNNINTVVLQQVISAVKAADMSNQKEVRLDITTAKNLSHTLALVMTRLAGNYEGLLQQQQKQQDEVVVKVEMDGGSWDKN
jgi:hypothetical protein